MDKKEKLWNLFFNNQEKGHFAQAIEVLQQLMGIEPRNPQIHLRMGDMYQKTKAADKAVSSYSKAASILEEEGFRNKALAIYKIILRIDPNNSFVINRLDTTIQEPQPVSAIPTKKIEAKTEPPSKVISLFDSLTQSEMEELIENAEECSFPKDSIIVREGDTDNSLYIIRKGILKITTSIMGKTIELGNLSDGDIFGEVAFLTGRPRTANIIASTDAEVIQIKEQTLRELTKKYPKIDNILRGFYESRIQETKEKIKVELTP